MSGDVAHTPWLRPVTAADTAPLHALLSLPPVFEFLCDGVAPEPAVVDEWITEALGSDAPFGLWLLERSHGDARGCVRLSPVPDGAASVELTYVLHPDEWGHGLATTMGCSALAHAFEHDSCDSVLAGADGANVRSVAVMRRLGMEHLRDVSYPAGPGVEYVLTRARLSAMPSGERLRFGRTP